MRFAEKLDRVLDDRDKSDRKLARACGVSPATVGRWRAGTSEPRLSELVAAAAYLEVPVGWLADDGQDDLAEVTTAERDLNMWIRRLGPEELVRRLVHDPNIRAVDVQPGPLEHHFPSGNPHPRRGVS
jgi:transcriptional regulator with XRE-family HTH domain